MGAIQEPTPDMRPYLVELRSESFYLTAPKDRLTNTATTWSVPIEDVTCVLAALDQMTNPSHNWFSTWVAQGRPVTGVVPRAGEDYPAATDGERVTLSGPAWLIERTDDGPYNLIELGYDTVEPLRRALSGIRSGVQA